MKNIYIIHTLKTAAPIHPQAAAILESINNMTEGQLIYFCNEVASYYIRENEKDISEARYRELEYLAKIVESGKNVDDLLLNDYEFWHEMLSELENLDEQYYLSQASPLDNMPISKESHINMQQTAHINEMIDQYVLKKGTGTEGRSDSDFCFSPVPKNEIPVQGWKLHISASDMGDYERLLSVVLPEFDKLGIAFKVVRPEELLTMNSSTQQGKAITIYPNQNFDISKFSPELMQILAEDSIHPIGDDQVIGRIHGRYGNFRGYNTHSLTAPDGRIEKDPKYEATYPDFVKERDWQSILCFYADCEKRYAETGDYKAYIQETATMTQVDGRSNAYVTLVLNDAKTIRAIDFASFADDNNMTFTYSINGQTYAMLHNGYADHVLKDLEEKGYDTNELRPNWDKRFNVYVVDAQDIDQVMTMVTQYNEQRCYSNAMPELTYFQFDTGELAIKVDTALNMRFEQECQMYNIHIINEYINLSYEDFEQSIEPHIQQVNNTPVQEGYDWAE